MQVDFRKTTLANLQQICAQIDKISQIAISHLRNNLLVSIRERLELLRSDLVLIHNQNFYLSCKVVEKDRQLKEFEQKYSHLQQSNKLQLHMLRAKCEKSLRQLKYALFNKKERAVSELFNEQIHKVMPSEVFDQSLPTPKKTLTFRDTHSALDHKDTLSKPQTHCKEQLQQLKHFRLEIRLSDSKSQQNHKKKPFIIKEETRSHAEAQEQDKKKRKKRKSSEAKQMKQQARKESVEDKRSQLAKLLSQQMKIPAMKEQYFSTDI